MIDYQFFQNVERAMKYVIYGDTDSLYINVPTLIPETPEEALRLSEEIGEEINQQITHYTENILLPKMGIESDYNETLFKTELVCDGMLLLPVKKNYAYSLLAIEGKITSGIEYTGIIKKSDIPPLTKDFIRSIIEDVIFNKEFRGQKLLNPINELAMQYNAKLKALIADLNVQPFATPKKWGSGHKKDRTPWQVTAMQLYNTIMDEHIFSPMAAGMTVPIAIANPVDFDNKISALRHKHRRYIGDTPLNNLTKLAIPYSYDPVKLKQVINYYGITIDENLCWGLVLNKVSKHIIETVRAHDA